MRPDIVNLRQFYSSRLGRMVKARLRQAVLRHWPNHSGEWIVGIGYALPVLRVIERTGPGTVMALMPAAQGAVYWPVHASNRALLGDEMRPPFAAGQLSRIVVMHAFEYQAAPEELLRVLWQLLAPGGQLLLMVPNRRSLWARYGRTPLASGTPYTLSQVKTLLQDTEFTLREISTALFAPPSAHSIWLSLGGIMEWIGHWFLPLGGGILLVEAEKQIYAGVGTRVALEKSAMRVGNVPV